MPQLIVLYPDLDKRLRSIVSLDDDDSMACVANKKATLSKQANAVRSTTFKLVQALFSVVAKLVKVVKALDVLARQTVAWAIMR